MFARNVSVNFVTRTVVLQPSSFLLAFDLLLLRPRRAIFKSAKGPKERHYISADSTNLSEKMVAAEEGNGDTSISEVDFGQAPSSAGVYAPNTVTAQH
jgi:hypothetical protein